MNSLLRAANSDVLYRRWPAGKPKAALLLVHGLGAHSARWNFLAEFMAGNGYPSYAIELKGFGQTPDRPRGHINSFATYYRDILSLRELIAEEQPDKKIFLLGESMGALIAFIEACVYQEKFAGQLLISPAFKNAMKFPVSTYLKLAAFILLDRKKPLSMPFNAAMCTRDAAYQKVMDNNPDELRTASIQTLLNIMSAQRQAGLLAKKLALPTLFLVPEEDTMINEAFNKDFFGRLTLEDKALISYPDMRHALSIELGREQVFADILNWLAKRS